MPNHMGYINNANTYCHTCFYTTWNILLTSIQANHMNHPYGPTLMAAFVWVTGKQKSISQCQSYFPI